MAKSKDNSLQVTQKKSSATSKMRSLLTFLFVITIAAGAGAYYLSLGYLKEYAAEVNAKVIDSEASANKVQQLQSLESEVGQNDSLIARANDIFASPSTFKSQAIKDIEHYSSLTGLNVTTTTFGDASGPVPGAAQSFVVEIASPASYSGLIRFLKGVENNIPKMEVTDLKMSRPASGSGDSVDIEDITMVIHVR